MCNNLFFRKLCCLRDNVEKFVDPDRPETTIWRMGIACWIPKDTQVHSEYVPLIAFPLQRWLHEHASVLRCTYIACLVWI